MTSEFLYCNNIVILYIKICQQRNHCTHSIVANVVLQYEKTRFFCYSVILTYLFTTTNFFVNRFLLSFANAFFRRSEFMMIFFFFIKCMQSTDYDVSIHIRLNSIICLILSQLFQKFNFSYIFNRGVLTVISSNSLNYQR